MSVRTRIAVLLRGMNIWPHCTDHPEARVRIDRSDAESQIHHVSCSALGCEWTARWPFGAAVRLERRRTP